VNQGPLDLLGVLDHRCFLKADLFEQFGQVALPLAEKIAELSEKFHLGLLGSKWILVELGGSRKELGGVGGL